MCFSTKLDLVSQSDGQGVQYNRKFRKFLEHRRLIESLYIFLIYMKIPFLFECTKLIVDVMIFPATPSLYITDL